ncbi:MAG TPA: hypothetical protein VNW98_04565 [Burkholderiaceae bacterium]|nr:hypothetical protein [Burkholderiaceae bacterium]
MMLPPKVRLIRRHALTETNALAELLEALTEVSAAALVACIALAALHG